MCGQGGVKLPVGDLWRSIAVSPKTEMAETFALLRVQVPWAKVVVWLLNLPKRKASLCLAMSN
jgi:hypothetical protein